MNKEPRLNKEPMKNLEKCHVLGVLDDGAASLSQAALAHLSQAQLVIGGSRTLELLAEHIAPQAEQRDLTGAMSQVPEWIRAADGQRVPVPFDRRKSRNGCVPEPQNVR